MKRIILPICLVLFAGCATEHTIENGKIVGIDSIEDLDHAVAFSFAIMSDNKGDSPASKEEFARMAGWIHDAGDRFVIGLGDHVKIGRENSFLPFLKGDAWWQEHFYPNVADGENEFYGQGQDDWGAGAPILDAVNLATRSHVEVRDNKSEYYAAIPVEGFTVHLIQLHFPDQPRDDSLAFRPDSRAYVIETLRGLEKGPKDIVVVGAHSITGYWLQHLAAEEIAVVMEKADLVLSATTHKFGRQKFPDYGSRGALAINTGSVTHPRKPCPPGYVQVHVLERPLALVVQYQDASQEARRMQSSKYAYIKIVGGDVLATKFGE